MKKDFFNKKIKVTICFTLIHFFYKIENTETGEYRLVSYAPVSLWGYLPFLFLQSKIVEGHHIEHYIELYSFHVEKWYPISKYNRYNILFFVPFCNVSNCVGHCLRRIFNG